MYRVREWGDNFENNRTRELKKLEWVPMPNKQDGDGYTTLLDHPDGAAHYGAWCAIVGVASKCDPRGTLSRDGARPHDAISLARITRVPIAILTTAISRLVSEVGWLEIVPDPLTGKGDTQIPHLPATESHFDASRVRAQEGNGREWKGMEEPDTCPPAGGRACDSSDDQQTPSVEPNASDAPPNKSATKSSKAAYTAAFERWYALYPRHEAKGKAAAAFGRVVGALAHRFGGDRDGAVDWLCEAAVEFSLSAKGKGEYVPHPATWLNEGRYDDDRSEWQRAGNSAENRAGQKRVGPGQRFDG